MGSIAFLIVMACLLFFSLGIAAVGFIGMLLCSRKTLRTLFRIVIAIGILGAIFPVAIVGIILYPNTVIPEDFVHTGIIIEDNIYENNSFTADGIVYQKLDIIVNSDACKDAHAVFSYKPSGILNRSQWCNFYRIASSTGFDFIWNGGSSLYCPATQHAAIMDHYATCDQQWFIGSESTDRPLSAGATAALLAYTPEDYTTITAQAAQEYIIQCRSADRLIWYQNISLVQIDSNLYYLHSITYHPDPLPPEYTISTLPENLAVQLLTELSN